MRLCFLSFQESTQARSSTQSTERQPFIASTLELQTLERQSNSELEQQSESPSSENEYIIYGIGLHDADDLSVVSEEGLIIYDREVKFEYFFFLFLLRNLRFLEN